MNTKYYDIGSMRIMVNLHASFFIYASRNGSAYFEVPQPDVFSGWSMNFDRVSNVEESKFETVFEGSDQFGFEIPYRWYVIKKDGLKGIFFELEKDQYIKKGVAFIDFDTKSVNVSLELHGYFPFDIDPFFHPIGILLLMEMIRYEGGFVIHASAVMDGEKGYLFSAVSGTGKSTMAKIWSEAGALVINDDRIIVMPSEDGWIVFNTPMPYYQDVPKSVNLTSVFLLKQSPENYLKELGVVQGTLGVMSNCMQHQYSGDHVKDRLSLLERVVNECGVFELGFKPDKDVVTLIRSNFG